MSKLKLLSFYFFLNLIILLIPLCILVLASNLIISIDFSYLVWCLISVPLLSNLILFIYLRKESLNGIYFFISLVVMYSSIYFFYLFALKEAFSNVTL